MIRKLTITDNDKLIEYLTEEKAINLFILGDIGKWNMLYSNNVKKIG